ncbi:uncharacterized membrane protein YidH (DUF202 family) [Kibdelosporangium banguiense]|uniref:Uncharacterized membrane protein YidH (DUF202 family) n=1 Tax=Kibdelosporangium banguiense TaxID=1365924 RepID=A0ABS4TJH3_9PSEU|nr:DUF202 domain-containing protein [Kibdelosporangium banguiense]MBP2323996.1 uncharacterized membrane protein YidH (DUF202 family) [Kibdelosporangium banguiense]
MNKMNRQPWDPGLQIERTALAWIRTCLSLIAVALVAFRFAAHQSLPLALGLAAAILPLAFATIWLAWRRYRTSAARLDAGERLPGGLLALMMTAVTVLTGVLGLAYVLLER